ncbi:GGDEF domain-containing protein [Vreelandella sp. EE22]
MLNAIKRLWSSGVAGNPVRLRRQIELCNQVGLLGAIATVPYQLFYFFYDFVLYRGVFFSNLIFMVAYLAVLQLNNRQWYTAAKKLLVGNVCSQLFVVTFFIGSEAGVHLFYFTLAAVQIFLYQRLPKLVYIVLMATSGALYITVHFLFTADRVITPIPWPWSSVMYAGSVVGVLTLLGVFLYLFRQQVDQAEDELTLSNQYLEALSNTDPLTGLANRRVLDKALEREWSRLSRSAGALAIVMCDVDHFKRFNDRYGHDGGDRCLQQIAAELRSILSRPSDLAVRYGGEEFALVLPGTNEQGARLLGERVREAIEGLHIPNEGVDSGAHVTISVGVSSIDSYNAYVRTQGAGHLVKRADQALYQAKANGRNRMVFLPYLRA